MPRLYLRADASLEMGTGHFMRCLALADAWAAVGGEAVFLCAGLLAPLERLALTNQHQVRKLSVSPDLSDAANTTAIIQQAPGWLVLDGYHFDSAYQRVLREAGVRFAAIDDFQHCDQYCCDVLINYSLDAHRYGYPSETTLLLGPEYALLRAQFSTWSTWRRHVPSEIRKILVTFGGGRTAGLAREVAWALPQWIDTPLEVLLLTGKLESELLPPTDPRVTFHVRERVEDMATWMAWADLAIAAAGTTCFELAAMGVPAVVVTVAENQRASAAAFAAAGTAVAIGEVVNGLPPGLGGAVTELAASEEVRRAMSRAGRVLVDGKGSERVAQVLLSM